MKKWKRHLSVIWILFCVLIMTASTCAAITVSNVETMRSVNIPPGGPDATCSNNIFDYTQPRQWFFAPNGNWQDLRAHQQGDMLTVKIECHAENQDPTARVGCSFGLSLYTEANWANGIHAWAWDVWTTEFLVGQTGIRTHTLQVNIGNADGISNVWMADYTCGCTIINGQDFDNDENNYWIVLV